MAETRAGLTAKTFLLPQAQPQMAAPQEQPFNDGVQALEGLQYVQGQTSDYYKKVSALKSFMQSVNKNLGIDVRVPDMSRPESIELNQIYQTAIADILAQGNELKQGASIHNMNVNAGATMNDSYYGQSAARAQDKKDYYRNLEKAVTETNDFTATPSYDNNELRAKQEAYNKLKSEYETRKAAEPDKAEYWDANIRALTPPAPRVYRPNSNYTAADRRYGRQVQAAGNLIKKTTNLLAGAHDSFQPNAKLLNASGNPLLVSTEFAQKKFGDGVIKEWRLDPDTDKISLIVQTNDGLKSIDVTGQDPQSLASTLSGLPQETITDAIYELDGFDQYQQLKTEQFLGKDAEQLKAKKKEAAYALGTADKIDKLKGELTEMKDKSWTLSPWETKQIGKFKIRRKGDKLEIENIQEALRLTGKDANSVYKANKTYSATPEGIDQLLKFLAKNGAVEEHYGTQVAPTTSKQGTIDSDI